MRLNIYTCGIKVVLSYPKEYTVLVSFPAHHEITYYYVISLGQPIWYNSVTVDFLHIVILAVSLLVIHTYIDFLFVMRYFWT